MTDNRLIQFPSNVFDQLTALRLLQVEGSQAQCDCSASDFAKRLEKRRVRVNYICATPDRFRGRSLVDISHADLSCERLETLYGSDGSTMFVCRVDDDLILDEFETSDGNGNENENEDQIEVQNIASNLFGEHNCVFEDILNADSSRANVRLLVTSEANENSKVSVNSMFKAELFVQPSAGINPDKKMKIQCPDSGAI